MVKLIYSPIASLDGYIEDEQGKFDWAAPDDEVHAFVNELERTIGTYLYGRRMYDTMVFWESAPVSEGEPGVTEDFAAVWRAAEKIVYSRTLQTVSSARTRIERDFDPEAIRRLKESAESDITIGGAELAGQAIAEGLVDESQFLPRRSSLGEESVRCPTASASSSTSWTSDGFAAASSTSTTASAADRDGTPP